MKHEIIIFLYNFIEQLIYEYLLVYTTEKANEKHINIICNHSVAINGFITKYLQFRTNYVVNMNNDNIIK